VYDHVAAWARLAPRVTPYVCFAEAKSRLSLRAKLADTCELTVEVAL
jgi:hypothetical protein